MFDPNNDTNYSPGADNYTPQGQNYNYGPQMPQIDIKKYLPIIIGIIVLLIAGFLILSWLGSQKEITIALVDSDGNPVAGTLKLSDESGRLIELTQKTKSTKFKATLFPGEYTAKVTSEGYNPVEGETVSITSEDKTGTTKKIELIRNLNATITVALDATKIYENQEITGRINIFNSGNEFNLSDVIPVATTPLEVKILPSGRPSLSAGGSVNLDFTVKIKTGSNLIKTVPASITFKIEGSKVTSQKFDISAMPAINPTELTMTPLLNTTVPLTAGKQVEYNLKFKNASKTIPLENLKVEIQPDTGSEDTLSWIEIVNSTTSASETTIPLIDPTKDQSIKIFVTAPLTAKKGDKFVGSVVLSSPSLKADKPYTIAFNVTTETTVNLVFKITPKTFPITCTRSTGVCTGMKTLVGGEAHFENLGSVAIENIELSLDLEAPEATASCQSYFKLNTTEIKSIAPGKKDEPVSIDIMNSVESPDTVVAEVCVLQWEYNNPLDPATKERDRALIEITKKTN